MQLFGPIYTRSDLGIVTEGAFFFFETFHAYIHDDTKKQIHIVLVWETQCS